MSNNSFRPIDRTLSGVTFPVQSEPESNSNEEEHYIPPRSKTVSSPSGCLLSYPGKSCGVSYPSADIQLVYSTAQADWTRKER